MKFVIAYSSRFGNGKRAVDVVEAELKAREHEVQVVNVQDADPARIPPADLYIFSAASEKFSLAVPMKKYLKKLPKKEQEKYALIITHAMDKKLMALPKMEKFLKKAGMVEAKPHIDFKIGDGSTKGDGMPDGYEEKLKEWVAKFA